MCAQQLRSGCEAKVSPVLKPVPMLDSFNLVPEDYPPLYKLLHQPVGISAPEGLRNAIAHAGQARTEEYFSAHLALKAKNKEAVRAAKRANKLALRTDKVSPPKPLNFSRAVEALLITGMNNFEERNAITAGSTSGHVGEAAL
jgi:hypothetical protein